MLYRCGLDAITSLFWITEFFFWDVRERDKRVESTTYRNRRDGRITKIPTTLLFVAHAKASCVSNVDVASRTRFVAIRRVERDRNRRLDIFVVVKRQSEISRSSQPVDGFTKVAGTRLETFGTRKEKRTREVLSLTMSMVSVMWCPFDWRFFSLLHCLRVWNFSCQTRIHATASVASSRMRGVVKNLFITMPACSKKSLRDAPWWVGWRTVEWVGILFFYLTFSLSLSFFL